MTPVDSMAARYQSQGGAVNSSLVVVLYQKLKRMHEVPVQETTSVDSLLERFGSDVRDSELHWRVHWLMKK